MGNPADEMGGHAEAGVDTDASESPRDRYLFAVDGNQPRDVLPLVCALVRDRGADLLIGFPVVRSETPSLEDPDPRQKGERFAAEVVLDAKEACGGEISIDSVVRVGPSRDGILQSVIDGYDVDTLVTEERPREGIRSLFDFDPTAEVSVPSSCDTIVVNRIGHLDSVDSILVPVGDGPHSGLAIETGLAVARHYDSSLELLHVFPEGDEVKRNRGEEILSHGYEIVQDWAEVETTLVGSESVVDEIIEYSVPFDITVFGAPRAGPLRSFMLGTVPDSVTEEATGTVLIAHQGGSETSWLDELL